MFLHNRVSKERVCLGEFMYKVKLLSCERTITHFQILQKVVLLTTRLFLIFNYEIG